VGFFSLLAAFVNASVIVASVGAESRAHAGKLSSSVASTPAMLAIA
jgi:hypothetical protein